MTLFEQAMEDYRAFFQENYPCIICRGYPGKTDEENIAIIRRCIAEKKPVVIEYDPDCEY